MICYHGTPVGGKRAGVAEFLMGRSSLVSYARPEDIAVACEVCNSVILDNGAFTIWKQGGSLDVDGYLQFVETWIRHPSVSWALIPDVIDGTEADNDALIRDWPQHFPGVPIWHYHESLERLERLSNEWRTVALGSSGEWPNPGTSKWWERTAEAMQVVCDDKGRPRCKLHGLRMLSEKIVRRLPLSSADSTNVVRNPNSVFPAPTRSQQLMNNALRIEAVQSASYFRFPRKQLKLPMHL